MEAKFRWYDMLYDSNKTLEHLINTKKSRLKFLKNEVRKNNRAIEEIINFSNELLWYLSQKGSVYPNIYDSVRDLVMEITIVSDNKISIEYFKQLEREEDEEFELFDGELFVGNYDDTEVQIIDMNKNPIVLNQDMWDSFIRNLNDEE